MNFGATFMFARTLFAPLCASVLLAGCGTYVPDIQEFPGDSRAGNQLVTAILTNVKCELRDALQDFYDKTHGAKTFLDDWGIQTDLNLTISEKGELSPTAELTPVSPANAVFTLGLGVNGSSQATRTDKIMSFNTVAELRALHRCDPRLRGGPWLLQSNLKLNEWLISALLGTDTNSANFATFTSKDSVLTHEVKFEVISGGDLTPSWKLVRATVNPSGTFLAVNRNRTHDLIITLGPTDVTTSGPNKGKRVPSRAAADAALVSQIGAAVGTSVNRAARQ
jgi:hypothetical protein